MPNVSEGRDGGVIRELAERLAVPGVHVLDRHSDPDHHRTVFTVGGDPMALVDGLTALAHACVELIDLRRHQGAHPRVGALDVAPIVALEDSDFALARQTADLLAERIGTEVGVPVFRYGAVAAHPDRTRPHDFRRDGLSGLAGRIDRGELTPDAGPPRAHPSAGVTLVGARFPVIAWNVLLATGGIAEARAMASLVRESDGGLPAVRALGLYLADRNMPQVSMNIEDYRVSPPSAVMAVLRRHADRLGCRLGDSELVGLIPRAALADVAPESLGLPGFRPGQILEVQYPALERGD